MAFDTSTYRRALEAQTRRIDDYQRVHFRRSTPKLYDTIAGFEPTQNSRNPERPFLQPRVLEFSRATAKAFLQQTESSWLKLDLSRQDATKELLDRKTGSFFVRSSTKAKYALTVRLDDNNPPVMHFLVHCNEQGFYIIQGSNLQFVSLYDMLAFFCFQQSGGMPCLLRPPVVKSKRDIYLLESDDSESEGEEDECENGEPVSSPPSRPQYDEIRFRSALTSQYSLQPTPVSANDPPPLPPRRRLQGAAYFDISQDLLDRVSRVSSLVDNDTGALIKTLERHSKLLERPHRTEDQSTPPTPSVNEPRSNPNAIPVRQAYKNFQIMSGEYSSSPKRISDHYEMAPNIPVKEIVTPILTTPTQSHDQPPAVPPKALPPPIPPKLIIPPKSKHDNANHLSAAIDTPPPLPPKPRAAYEINKPRSKTHYSSESEAGRRMTTTSRLGHRRASSDSSIMSGLSEEVPSPISPPPLPPNHPRETEDIVKDIQEKDEREVETKEGWTFVEKSDVSPPATPSTTSSNNTPAKIKWKKPRWAKKLKKWRRKPRSRVKHYILDLSNDTTSVFGARVHYFIETVLMRSDPHQKLFSDVRMFMGKMRELLLTDYKVELLGEGLDSCQNFEHLLESTLQQCIILPLNSFLHTRLKDNLIQNGSFSQVENAINNALTKTPEELGIRSHLLVPNEKSLLEINNIFTKLKDSYNAMRKMEYLLEAVRLTYEAVRDANNPKKAMHDLGADDFLPLFVWVLAHSNFNTAEIEAEYIWGLAHPSLFNGEGGYYLTTLTSAVNVLKECCCADDNNDTDFESQDLPNMNSLKTQLPIAVQDPLTGKVGSPTSIPVLPTMTVSEICDVISSQYNVPNSEIYRLYTQAGNTVTRLSDTDCPQEMNIGWELESERETDRPILVYMSAEQ